jgi:predicted flap endonuclease-1-like 5' DNA nuclease
VTKIAAIKGIDEAHVSGLAAIGITTLEVLLSQRANQRARSMLANRTGIDDELILGWVNRADLCRIRGISVGFANLLAEAGVATVVELSHRNPQHLRAQLEKANAAKGLTGRMPSDREVGDWVEQAMSLPRAVSY